MQIYKTQVKEIKQLAPRTLEMKVGLVLPREINFLAGQFMQFIVGNEFRSYSIVSVPDHNHELVFCFDLKNSGVGTNFIKSLKVGDEIKMRGPLGAFTFDKFERNVFFAATGVGVAPFKSIIEDILSRGYKKDVCLLFGLRSEQDIFYHDEFSRLAEKYKNFKFIQALSKPQNTWDGHNGRITSYLDVNYLTYQDYIFYICGGIDPVKDIRSLLIDKGHDPMDIKLEIFT